MIEITGYVQILHFVFFYFDFVGSRTHGRLTFLCGQKSKPTFLYLFGAALIIFAPSGYPNSTLALMP